jgi:hypothetical protein
MDCTEESHHLFKNIKICLETILGQGMPQGYIPGSENHGMWW